MIYASRLQQLLLDSQQYYDFTISLHIPSIKGGA